MIFRYFSAGLVAITLAGCTVGPDYKRPDLDVGESYRAPVTLDRAKSIADIAWFDLFQDPQLEELIRIALENNLELEQAVARIEQAQARLRIARSSFAPDIRGQINNSPEPGGHGNDASFSGGLVIGWELDVFGKLRRLNEAARASLLASEDGARAVMSSLVTTVSSTWFRLLELDEEIRIIERAIQTQSESLELVRTLKENGVASDAEEQQAIAQLASTRARLPLAKQQVAAVEHSLSVLLGRAPAAIYRRQKFEEVERPLVSPLMTGLPAELLERRPDVRRAENLLHAATAQQGVAIANRFPFPTIGLTGLFGRYTSGDFDDLFDSDDSINVNAWGPTLDLQIIDFGRARGNVEVAEAQTRQALAAYRGAVLQALREVANSLYAYDSSAMVIEQSQIYTNAARKNLRLQRLRFKSGVVSYLTVLDAERQVLIAEVNLAKAQLSRTLSYIDIYRALGGGWSDEELRRVAGTDEAVDEENAAEKKEG